MTSNKALISFVFTALLCSSLGYWMGRRSLSNAVAPDTVYAQFKGGVVTAKEVNDVLQNELDSFNKTRALARKKITIEQVRQKLLEVEAGRRKITVNQLFLSYQAEHANDPVTHQDIEEYARGQGVSLAKITPQQKDIFTRQIRNTRSMRLAEKMMDELYQNASVKLNPDLTPSETK